MRRKQEQGCCARSILTSTLLVVSCVWALASLSSGQQSAVKNVPTFEQYPITTIYRGKPARPILTADWRYWRSRIREGAREGPNFAGHYTIVEWGCGSGCISSAMVDAISGRIYPMLGNVAVPYMGKSTGGDYEGLKYQKNSSLLMIDGCPDESDDPCGTSYYVWKNHRFIMLRMVRIDRKRE